MKLIHRAASRGSSPPPPARNRPDHANTLIREIGEALNAGRQQIAMREAGVAEGETGFYLEFNLPATERVAAEKLENRQKRIELVAVQPPAADTQTVAATVFVPEASSEFFLSKIKAYRDEDTARSQRPKNEALISRIDSVRLGVVRSLFTDDPTLFPTKDQAVWWEVWLRDDRMAIFLAVASRLTVTTKMHTLRFPERDVVLVLADREKLERLVHNTNAVAELRLAKDTPSVFLEMRAVEQADWAHDLADRIILPSVTAPAVCVLDSGATQGHPLLAPALDPSDQHSYDPDWGVGDSAYWHGHGTAMAGIALYGDLEAALTTSGAVGLDHRLETVKILPPSGQNDPELYGAITARGIEAAEAQASRRLRVFCMAVTSDVGLGRGRPSSWSAAVDQLCYGGGDLRRLIVLAAGNLRGDLQAGDYPDQNDLAEIENPAQAWNPLVVGAYTEKPRLRIRTTTAGTALLRQAISHRRAAHRDCGIASGRSARMLSLRMEILPMMGKTPPLLSTTCNSPQRITDRI